MIVYQPIRILDWYSGFIYIWNNISANLLSVPIFFFQLGRSISYTIRLVSSQAPSAQIPIFGSSFLAWNRSPIWMVTTQRGLSTANPCKNDRTASLVFKSSDPPSENTFPHLIWRNQGPPCTTIGSRDHQKKKTYGGRSLLFSIISYGLLLLFVIIYPFLTEINHHCSWSTHFCHQQGINVADQLRKPQLIISIPQLRSLLSHDSPALTHWWSSLSMINLSLAITINHCINHHFQAIFTTTTTVIIDHLLNHPLTMVDES